MVQRIRWFLVLILVIAGVFIAVQNTHSVEIDFFTYTGSQPLLVLLLVSMSFGFLLGAVMTSSMLRSHRKRRAAAAKANAKVEKAEKRAAKAEAALQEKIKETPAQVSDDV